MLGKFSRGNYDARWRMAHGIRSAIVVATVSAHSWSSVLVNDREGSFIANH